MNINLRIKLFFIIISLYYIPYLIFNWAGAAGFTEGSAPNYYKILQVILPICVLKILNKKVNIEKKFDVLMAGIILLISIIHFFLIGETKDSFNIRTILFFALYLFFPSIELKEIKIKYLYNVVYFTEICLLFEKIILPKYFNILPIFVMEWQERYIGNMGGPNTLGTFINIIYILILLKGFSENKKITKQFIFITFLCGYIIKLTDSDGAIINFIISIFLLIVFFLKKNKVWLFISINIGILFSIFYSSKIYNIIENYWKKFQVDGSNIIRLESIKIGLKNVEFFSINQKFQFNESPFFMILFSYGILTLILFLLLFFFVYIFRIHVYIKNKSFFYFKTMGIAQIMIYSLVLPNIYIFPINLLYILFLKLKY